MKIEGYIFAFIAVFLVPVTIVYWVLSQDPTGTTCLALSIGLTFMVGYYLLFTARRMEARPEDRPDAEISEGSGEIGFFPPHSWWPIALAGSFAVTMPRIRSERPAFDLHYPETAGRVDFHATPELR